MTSAFTIECRIEFKHRGRGSRKRPRSDRESSAEAGRVPRISRLMALALRLEELIRSGQAICYSELARLGHVTRARLSQIVSLLGLAPDIQEEILFLPRTLKGRGPDSTPSPLADCGHSRLAPAAGSVEGTELKAVKGYHRGPICNVKALCSKFLYTWH
jgi:hypothetical protein